MTKRTFPLAAFLFLFFFSSVVAQLPEDLSGKWTMIPDHSASIPLLKKLTLEVAEGSSAGKDTLFFIWGTGNRTHRDTLLVRDGQYTWHIPDRVFPLNVFQGVRMPAGETLTGPVSREDTQNSFSLKRTYTVLTSQGHMDISEADHFSLLDNHNLLRLDLSLTFGDQHRKYKYLFKKEGYREAYAVKLSDDWKLNSDLDVQVLLLSMQGLVNRDAPRLYFIYPEGWDFRFTGSLMQYLTTSKYFTFKPLQSLRKTFTLFRDDLKGYIIWDKERPVTLDVAFTLAGLKDAIVISEDLLPLVEGSDLPLVADLRKMFTGMSNPEIYRWVFERYRKECSPDMLVWLGGETGNVRKPGIADWGVMNRAFFADLSTEEKDTTEYEVSREIFSSYQPLSILYGWHVYGKDKERDYVKLASRYGLRVEGLHTLPNISFVHHIPLDKDFSFHNNHSAEAGKKYKPEKKVYISCVQTDCLGLGAWNQPGRGEIPYAWEVTMNWYHIAPVLLEYFYSQATPRDYFIGSLSGPGYIYPKAVPDTLLPALLDSAWSLMQALDLNVFEIMDYSQGATLEGNTDLTKKVIDTYYKHMPGSIGFINGYAPAFTFTVKNKVPLISYDYYLDPGRSIEEAINDIHDLAGLNPIRPYFLLMHVRQWNNIDKVVKILQGLGNDYETVPLDIFLKMAGERPTFREYFLKTEQK